MKANELTSGMVYKTVDNFYKVGSVKELYVYNPTTKVWDACSDTYNSVIEYDFKEVTFITKMENLSVNDVILVKQSEADPWKKAHFARYVDDVVYVWKDGKSSRTAIDANDVMAAILVEVNFLENNLGDIIPLDM